VRPVHYDVLAARLNAMIRRASGHTQPTVKIGDVTVHLDRPHASVMDKPLTLSPKEYQILRYMALRSATNPPAPVTQQMFIDQIYNGRDEPQTKTIDVLICRIRKKMSDAAGGRNFIHNLPGQGYVLKDETAQVLTTAPAAPQETPLTPIFTGRAMESADLRMQSFGNTRIQTDLRFIAVRGKDGKDILPRKVFNQAAWTVLEEVLKKPAQRVPARSVLKQFQQAGEVQTVLSLELAAGVVVKFLDAAGSDIRLAVSPRGDFMLVPRDLATSHMPASGIFDKVSTGPGEAPFPLHHHDPHRVPYGSASRPPVPVHRPVKN